MPPLALKAMQIVPYLSNPTKSRAYQENRIGLERHIGNVQVAPLNSVFYCYREVLRSSNISGKRGLRKLDEQLVKMMKSHKTNLFQVETDVLGQWFDGVPQLTNFWK